MLVNRTAGNIKSPRNIYSTCAASSISIFSYFCVFFPKTCVYLSICFATAWNNRGGRGRRALLYFLAVPLIYIGLLFESDRLRRRAVRRSKVFIDQTSSAWVVDAHDHHFSFSSVFIICPSLQSWTNPWRTKRWMQNKKKSRAQPKNFAKTQTKINSLSNFYFTRVQTNINRVKHFIRYTDII